MNLRNWNEKITLDFFFQILYNIMYKLKNKDIKQKKKLNFSKFYFFVRTVSPGVEKLKELSKIV